MAKDKIYKASDLAVCGFALQRLFGQLYPEGLTAAQIEAEAKKHGWMRRIYDLAVVGSNGNI